VRHRATVRQSKRRIQGPESWSRQGGSARLIPLRA
jgi:hypothetical protein